MRSITPGLSRLAMAIPLAVLVACGGDDAAEEAEMPEEMAEAPTMEMEDDRPRVEITAPADGSTVDGSEVTVTLATHGARVEAADNRQTEGRGHHHIFLDDDVTAPGEPIPPTSETVIHMGDGSEEYTFSDLEPGEHRVIAVFAYGDHVPNAGVAQDTVTFTVSE